MTDRRDGPPSPAGVTVLELDPATLESILDRHRVWLATGGADGERAELAGACLRGKSLWRADLRQAGLDRADLRGANLDHARLGGASLKGASLIGASLWGADLVESDLAGADLRDAKLDHASLNVADLTGAVLAGASFWGTHLEGADLSEAIGLVPAQLEAASRDAATRLPVMPQPPSIPAATAQAGADDEPVLLDEHRGMMAQKATEVRRHLAAFEAEQAALRQRQTELERHLLAAPAATWEDAVEKARYLLALFAATSEGRDPRRQKVIASVLGDFRRLSAGQTAGGPEEPGSNDRPS